jgi:hypothetical protein
LLFGVAFGLPVSGYGAGSERNRSSKIAGPIFCGIENLEIADVQMN